MPSAPGIARAVLLLSQRLQQEPPLGPGGAQRAPVLGLLATATFPTAAQRRKADEPQTCPALLPRARIQKLLLAEFTSSAMHPGNTQLLRSVSSEQTDEPREDSGALQSAG